MREALVLTLTLVVGILIGSHLTDLGTSAPTAFASTAIDRIAPYRARQNTDTTGRMAVPCPAGGVTLILGQSNAANYAGGRFAATHGAVDRLDGRCYRAAGATLGSDGIGGSVWPLVADLLGQPMQFVGLAIGATSSAEWADPERLGGLLAARLAALRMEGVEVERVVWHQGESDVGTAPATYSANLRHVIVQVQAAYPSARFFLAQASACMNNASRPALLAAQASLVDGVRVLRGPDTDVINKFGDRYDGCHFSESGVRKEAAGWAAALKEGG